MSAYETTAKFTAMDSMSDVVGNIGKNIADFGASVGQSMGALGPVFEGVFGALGPILQAGVDHLLEVGDAMGMLAARGDLLPVTLKKYQDAAENLFKSGLVKNFGDAAAAVENLNLKVKNLGDAKIDTFLQQAAAVGKAWGISAKDVIEGVSDMQRNFKELEGDPFKALDMLTATAQKSTLPLGQINTIVDKYGDKFAAAGLSAAGMSGMIVEAALQGINPTSGMAALSAAVDKFHQNVINPPAQFTAALQKLGLGTVAADLKNNKITMDQALESVFTKLDEIKNPAQRAQIAMALFGKGIDKIGGADTLASMAGFSNALGGDAGIAGSADKVRQKIDALPETSFQKLKNSFETTAADLVEKAATALTQLPTVIGYWINEARLQAVFTIALWKDWIKNRMAELSGFLSDPWTKISGTISGIAASVGAAIKKFAQPILDGLKPVMDLINNILNGLGLIASNTPAGGNSGGGGGGAHATGGYLDPGWNLVGEQGPELVNSNTGLVLTNKQTTAQLSAPRPSGGNKTEIHNHYELDGATIVDMATFNKMQYRMMQEISLQRGGTS